MRSGDVRAAAAVAAVVVALSGCSDERAGTLPPPSPTTLAPTTPTPTVSADYAAQARIALQAYIDALYAAGLDPANKTDELAVMLSPTCTCRDVLRVLREEARLGRYIDYQYTLRDVLVIDAGPLGANLSYTVHQSAGAERERSGRVVTRFKPAATRYAAHLVRVDGRWLLDRVEEQR